MFDSVFPKSKNKNWENVSYYVSILYSIFQLHTMGCKTFIQDILKREYKNIKHYSEVDKKSYRKIPVISPPVYKPPPRL